MVKNIRPLRMVSAQGALILLALSLLLTACQKTATPVAVAPITGLPQGTDGMAWWNDTVFYQIFVRSFYDSNGDGIGDLNGITQKLDYLNDGDPTTSTDLGVSGLWLMPIFPSPSYHGYDVTDYYAVNPDYGSVDDLKALIAAAHERGLRVIIDMVINHTSSQHPWFIEANSDPASPKRNWYIWEEKSPGYKGPWGQSVWYKGSSGYYYAVFWDGMPDLNIANPEVLSEIEAVTRFWLSDVGVDGFRLDGAKHMVEDGQRQENTQATHQFWQTYRSIYKGFNPQALTVGEVWSDTALVVQYLQGNELDLAFEFDLADSIMKGANNNYSSSLRQALTDSLAAFPPNQFATFLTNHDMNRSMNTFFGNVDKAKTAAGMLLTLPGVPFIYYGEELGMTGIKPDENIRTPMQWAAEANAGFTSGSPWRHVNSEYLTVNVASESGDPASLLSFYRDLIQLRNQHAALRVGDTLLVEADRMRLLTFLRISQEETILVIHNPSDKPMSDYNLSLAEGPLQGVYQPVLLFSRGAFSDPLPLQPLTANSAGGFDAYLPVPVDQPLPPYSLLILQLHAQK